jgi:hypothetical protein
MPCVYARLQKSKMILASGAGIRKTKILIGHFSFQQQRSSQTPPQISAPANTNHQKDFGKTIDRMITTPIPIAINPQKFIPFLRIKTRPFAKR